LSGVNCIASTLLASAALHIQYHHFDVLDSFHSMVIVKLNFFVMSTAAASAKYQEIPFHRQRVCSVCSLSQFRKQFSQQQQQRHENAGLWWASVSLMCV